MRKQHMAHGFANLLSTSLFVLAGTGAVWAQPTVPEGPLPWNASPYRSFGPAQALSATVVLRDEANDPSLRQALSDEIARLSTSLFEQQGWPVPFAAADPLRIFVSRREAAGVRRLVARSLERRHLVTPTIEIDGSNLSDAEIVREAARLFALAAISSYGVPDTGFLTTAAAELLSAAGDSEQAREAALAVAAAPTVVLRNHARTMGRAFLEEFARAAGGARALRLVWERASERGEDLMTSLVATYVERTDETGESLLLRFAARLYTAFEPEPGPSNISLYDLESGAFDAAAPAEWSFRHRTYLPEDRTGALKLRWPAGAGAGAAVVRYSDPQLPPDVVFLAPESVHAVPLSGVSRVDWVVAGAASPGSPSAAFFDAVSGFPFAGLAGQADSSAEGSRVGWTTASHDGLAGWAVFREEVLSDGRIVRTGPQIVPASAEASNSFRYVYIDPDVHPATYYRYSVWAVTEDGLLAKAFSEILRSAE
jgi:hypothetical protein